MKCYSHTLLLHAWVSVRRARADPEDRMCLLSRLSRGRETVNLNEKCLAPHRYVSALHTVVHTRMMHNPTRPHAKRPTTERPLSVMTLSSSRHCLMCHVMCAVSKRRPTGTRSPFQKSSTTAAKPPLIHISGRRVYAPLVLLLPSPPTPAAKTADPSRAKDEGGAADPTAKSPSRHVATWPVLSRPPSVQSAAAPLPPIGYVRRQRARVAAAPPHRSHSSSVSQL